MGIKIALAGNPNSGKTTLFNDLTGSQQYVGNWPGVTVEKKEGKIRGHKDVVLQDLPGIYSLSPYTLEEVVSRNYLVKEKPDAIINIIDGTNIERNLYLTTQLLELNIPMIIALNMMDLVKKNAAIMKSIMDEIRPRNCQGILLVVSNPVDILTQVALRYSGMPENRVIGSGTVLDTARLKYLLGEHLQVDSRSVHAFIIGEHGDSEIAAWSSANVSGVPLHDFCEMRGHYQHEKAMHEIAETVKNSAYEIIARKHATYYGVAMTVKRICAAILRDEKSILPISSMMHGEYGIEGVALSLPAIVGKNGMEGHVPIPLSDAEQQALRQSAETLRRAAEAAGL